MSQRVIRRYHAFTFFFSLLFWAPIFYEYQRQLGLSDPQIFSIQSIYYLAFCFLELPTGFLADRFGHRESLRWAAGTLLLANLLPIFWPTFGGFLLHWLLMALARSLMSGSASAYLYDYLERSGEEKYYRQTEGNARALSLFGRVLAWAAVGPLMQWQFDLPYWLTSAAALAAIIVAARFPSAGKPSEPPAFSNTLHALKTNPRLWQMMAAGLSIFVLARLVQINLFQPLLTAKSYGVATFGLVMGITTLFEAGGSAAGEQVAKRLGDLATVFWAALIMALSTVFLPLGGGAATFLLLSLFAVSCGVAYPVQRKLLNDAIEHRELRATLLSVESLLDRLVCSAMAAGVAVFMGRGQLDLLLYLGGGLSLFLTAWLLGLLRRSFKR